MIDCWRTYALLRKNRDWPLRITFISHFNRKDWMSSKKIPETRIPHPVKSLGSKGTAWTSLLLYRV